MSDGNGNGNGRAARARLVARLNELLRGEMAAVETYRKALEKVGDEPGSAQLRSIQADHSEAVGNLRRHVLRSGGTPTADAGAWAALIRVLEDGTRLLGDTSALGLLKQGEEEGARQYESVLDEDELPVDCRRYIHTTLLPRQHHHISTLRRWMEVQ